MASSRQRRVFGWLFFGVMVAVISVRFSDRHAHADERAKNGVKKQAKAHPLDPALKRAQEGLTYIEENVDDYTATIVKQERIGGKLGETQFISAKIRNRKVKDGKVVVPFAVYMKFVKPDDVKGREVIWAEGQNNGKLIAHEAGLLGFKRFHLKPEGVIAMMGQLYPITKIGIQTLVEELILRGERERKHGECEVNFYKNTKVDKRSCTLIQVMHPTKRDHFDFYRARIYIDNELQVPIRYAAWSWPEKPGGEPVLLEAYTYRNIKLNVGLTDKDFDPDNPDYDYP